MNKSRSLAALVPMITCAFLTDCSGGGDNILPPSPIIDASPEAGCVTGDRRCQGKLPQTCDIYGQWQDGTPCPFVCQDGACKGVCGPGEKRCLDLIIQTCDTSGVWQDGTACGHACQNGVCTGDCSFGEKRCLNDTPQLCDAQGAWTGDTPCSHQVCVNGTCQGVCGPGDTQCDGLVPRTCSPDGQWQDGTPCPFVCQDGACKGVCGPGEKQCYGNTAHVCDQSGQWNDQACSGNTPTCCNGSCTTGIVEVKVGRYHTCARKNDGTVWCLGKSDYGELGDGATGGQSCGQAPEKCRLAPVQVSALGSEAVGLGIGYDHACARKNDSTLWCWGYNGYGQLGNGSSGPYEASPVQVSDLGNTVAEVAIGSDHTCARKNDGTVWCWGAGNVGQLGGGMLPSFLASPSQVTALGSGTIQIASCNAHTCARKDNGTLWCWGANPRGQLGTTSGAACGISTCIPLPVQIAGMGTSSVDVSTGSDHTCALKDNGTLWCWGFNGGGELGNGAITGPDCYGYCSASPVQASSLGSTVAKITASSDFNFAIDTDGSVWAWGGNIFGELGDGTTSGQACWNGGPCKPLPAKSASLGNNVLSVHSTSLSSCAVKNDGTLWCWGKNDYGQLGDGTMIDKSSPVRAMCQ